MGSQTQEWWNKIENFKRNKDNKIMSEARIFIILLSACLIGYVCSVPADETGAGCGEDAEGLSRQPGDSWQEDCNRCRCLATGVKGCTRRWCGGDGQDRSLFRRIPGKDVSQTAQCRQAGVSDCVAVSMNYQHLDTVGQSISLIEGSGVTMNLRHPPTGSSSLSYNFSLADGGEGIVTVRHNAGSVFASIRPNTGPVLFYIEACGQGCTVMYQRQKSFFNQFTD